MDFFIESFPAHQRQTREADLTAIAHAVGGLIESSTWNIFSKYREELLAEEITYIVPAVWGADRNTALTPLQQEIHDQITPVLQDIFGKLDIDDITDPHTFAVGYIVRYTMITKIIYMIECFRNRFNVHDLNEQSRMNLLSGLAPYGNA